MATYKVTFIFNQGRYGWSESYYVTKSNFQTANVAAEALAKARAKLTGNGSFLEAWRVSDVNQKAICGLVDAGELIGQQLATDTPWSGALANVCALDLYRRSLIIRGIPDDWVKFDLVTNKLRLQDPFFKAFEGFANKLKTEPWQLKVFSKDPAEQGSGAMGPPTLGAGGKVAFVYSNPALAVGETVRISGIVGPDASTLNGVFKVLANTGTGITIDLDFAFLSNPAADTSGKAARRKVIYANITDVFLERAVKKSTGRAFFVSRGRRSKAK